MTRLRRRAGGQFIRALLNSAMGAMRAHPKAWGIGRGIDVTRNLCYREGIGSAGLLDVYRPSDVTGPLPVLMYIHGGGFRILSKDTHWMMNTLFARAGYVVFSINYRMVPQATYPGAIEDAAAAAGWIQDHAAELGADPSRWVIAGESAGGNLTCGLTIASCGPRDEPFARELYERDIPIKAALPACGILEVSNCERFKQRKPKLSTLLSDRIEGVCRGYLGGLEGDAGLADPLRILESDWQPTRPLPPMMSICGTRDPILDDTRRLGKALEARGVEHKIEIYEGGIHAFHAVFWKPNSVRAWADQLGFLGAQPSLSASP